MKRLHRVDHNINIGHCKVYSRDFVTYILWFIKLLNSEFRIRIPHFGKKVVDGFFFFGVATSGSVHGVGAWDPKLEQSNNSIVKYMSFY